MEDLAKTIPMPPDEIPSFRGKGHSKKLTNSTTTTKEERNVWSLQSSARKDLIFTFCTHENVNVVSDILDNVRHFISNNPKQFKAQQQGAIQAVKDTWEKEHSGYSTGDVLAFATGGLVQRSVIDQVGATINITNTVLDFGSNEIGTEKSSKIHLTFGGAGELKITVNHIPSSTPRDAYDIVLSHSHVTLSRTNAVEVEVRCCIRRSDVNLREMIVFEIDRSGNEYSGNARSINRLCALVTMSTGSAVFGVPIDDLELDTVTGIPKVLNMLKDELFNSGGCRSEGIFRCAAEKNQLDILKEELNARKYVRVAPKADVNCMANLIKIWFREMPSPILSAVNVNDILQVDSIERCVELIKGMKEPHKTLLVWCLDMLVDVVLESKTNFMSPKNCAIVMAPNFIASAKNETSGGMKSIMLLQKAVLFTTYAIQHRLAQRRAGDSEKDDDDGE